MQFAYRIQYPQNYYITNDVVYEVIGQNSNNCQNIYNIVGFGNTVYNIVGWTYNIVYNVSEYHIQCSLS